MIIIPGDPEAFAAKARLVAPIIQCPYCAASTPGEIPLCAHCGRRWIEGYPECPFCREPVSAHKLDCPIRPCKLCNRLRCHHIAGESERGEGLLLCPGQRWRHGGG